MSGWSSSFGKRLFDLFAAAIGILFLAPLLLLIGLVILIFDGSPVFYRQRRVGRGGQHFSMLKFRTMTVGADRQGGLLTVGQDPRVTRLGAVLRKFKLDELPQLFNVLVGEMSLVGPRPEVPKYTSLYREGQKAILNLKPGITDISTVLFRRESDLLGCAEDPEQFYIHHLLPHKVAISMEYARQATLWSDLAIIFRTLRCLHR